MSQFMSYINKETLSNNSFCSDRELETVRNSQIGK